MNIVRYAQQAKDVAIWNSVARGDQTEFGQEDYDLQMNFIEEEARELVAACASRNAVGVLDGGGDLFVTFSYLYTMVHGDIDVSGIEYQFENPLHDWSEKEDWEKDFYIMTGGSSFTLPTIVSVEAIEENTSMGTVYLYALLEAIEKRHGVDMHAVIDDVCESNWSKYPKVEDMSEDEAKAMCKWIEENRDKQNVAYSLHEPTQRYVFRDNYGKGKVCKPSEDYFFEPDLSVHLE